MTVAEVAMHAAAEQPTISPVTETLVLLFVGFVGGWILIKTNHGFYCPDCGAQRFVDGPGDYYCHECGAQGEVEEFRWVDQFRKEFSEFLAPEEVQRGDDE